MTDLHLRDLRGRSSMLPTFTRVCPTFPACPTFFGDCRIIGILISYGRYLLTPKKGREGREGWT